jgi:pilus assembly protein CpaF
MGWEVIAPFLRPIEPLLQDPEITDILVNGASAVFVERQGRLQEVPGAALTEKSLQVAVRNIARVLGDEISPEKPLLDSRLPDGSRVAAILPPCSVTGTVLAIRKFHGPRYGTDELVRLGTLTPEVLARLRSAIEHRENILISGSTGSGKTTLLNSLASFIPPEERVVVIEDTSELQIGLKNIVRLEARREQASVAAVTIRDLLRATLRLRPDRILLGEVRGGEAFDLLQALNTGHAGTLATLHANSAGLAIARFTTCVLMSGIDLPYRALRANIADALHLLVHIERRDGQRRVTQVYGVCGYDSALDRYDLEVMYERQ